LASVNIWPRRLSAASIVSLAGAGLLIAQWSAARPLWVDEEMIALNVRDRAFSELAAPLSLGQSAPLGWLALQRAVLLVFGDGERALRLVPVAFGLGLLAAIVWIGRRWLSPVGAVTLVLLCSFGKWLTYYCLELKHYSADMFWAVLIPALAAWAIEAADDPKEGFRRAVLWWTTAALGQWFGNGAILVAPACALTLIVTFSRRQGWRFTSRIALLGIIGILSSLVLYELSLRHTLSNQYLTQYWASQLPPRSAGPAATVRWLGTQLEPVAVKPGGSGLWITYWLTAAAGLVLLIRTRAALGLVLAAVPLTAIALAVLRVVPLYERLSLWTVPALYVGIAVFADDVAQLARRAYSRRHWVGVAAAVLGTLVAIRICADIVYRGVVDLRGNRPIASNHQLDDRTAVRWLMSRYQPGDALVTTRLALPAVWWYGHIPILRAALSSSHERGGAPTFRVGYVPPGPDCPRTEWRHVLEGQRRLLVYLGFRFDDVPGDFDELLLNQLRDLGAITQDRRFAERSRALVVDLRFPHSSRTEVSSSPGHRLDQLNGATPKSAGCVAIGPASTW
jgi:hypothetical protein